jgi:hypothetical protein
MNPLARSSLVVVAVLVAGLSLGFASLRADELPADTNTIESLTVEQARKLANAFPGVEVEIKERSKIIDLSGERLRFRYTCLPLNGLRKLDADTAKALAEFKGDLYLEGLTTLDAGAAKALAATKNWDGDLSRVTALDSPDSVAIAQALATRKGPLRLPKLKKLSPKTLTALIQKEDVEIPLIETLELIPEPDGSATDDFVIPDGFQQRQQR